MNCCFTGHRDLPETEKERIYKDTLEAVENLVRLGVKTFICGGAVGYDMLCGEIVLKLKEAGEDIKLVMAQPCGGQDKYFSENDKIRYKNLTESADEVHCLAEHYFRGCMQARNRYMVDNSEYVIAYCKKTTGGTAYTKNYAVKKGKNVIDIV